MDVVELAAARHGCKVCGKSFLCGRSLGGHMRSHISLGESAVEVHTTDELSCVSPDGGRRLRKNPRKTRRLCDFADEEDVGHGVRDDNGEHKACRECGKLFSSWRSLLGHMRRHARGSSYRHDEDDMDVGVEEFLQEETEAEMVTPMQPLTVLSASPRRRRRSMRVAAPPTAPPPPVPSGFETETEDVALCLLMLSRDTGMCSSPAKDEPLESAKKIKIKIKGGVAKNRKRGSPKQQRGPVAPKRTRYECPGCGKLFSSYQALGGHRASHKRMNASCSSLKITPAASPAPEPSTETHMSFNTLSPSASPDSVAIGFGNPKDNKRSPLMSCESNGVELCYDGDAGADYQEQHSAPADGLLDLNFPPAAAEET